MRLCTLTAASAIMAGLALAHGPSSREEVEAFQARQASAYHCAPAVAALTAQRKRNWAQKVLGGAPLAMKQYFVDSGTEASEQGKQIMACDPVQETRIRNSTCVLAPETTEGPYYHSEGHPIRSNMAENQLGLLFLMNVGVIDVETCEPVPNVLVDLWMANATGYYAGHPSPKRGLENEVPAQTGKRRGLLSAYPRDQGPVGKETWLRGALPTDQNGVTEFTSVFPGYYTGRATHVHVKVHPEWTALPNGTFTSGRLVHTGQFFVDDDLNQQIDKLQPYNENPLLRPGKGGRTRNWDDSLQIFQTSFDNGYMPMFDIEFLGGVLQQGLIGYVTMGVNMSASYEGVWSPESGRGGAVKQVPVEELKDNRSKTEL